MSTLCVLKQRLYILWDRDINSLAFNTLWNLTNTGSSVTVGFRFVQPALPEDGALAAKHVSALCVTLICEY